MVRNSHRRHRQLLGLGGKSWSRWAWASSRALLSTWKWKLPRARESKRSRLTSAVWSQCSSTVASSLLALPGERHGVGAHLEVPAQRLLVARRPGLVVDDHALPVRPGVDAVEPAGDLACGDAQGEGLLDVQGLGVAPPRGGGVAPELALAEAAQLGVGSLRAPGGLPRVGPEPGGVLRPGIGPGLPARGQRLEDGVDQGPVPAAGVRPGRAGGRRRGRRSGARSP